MNTLKPLSKNERTPDASVYGAQKKL